MCSTPADTQTAAESSSEALNPSGLHRCVTSLWNNRWKGCGSIKSSAAERDGVKVQRWGWSEVKFGANLEMITQAYNTQFHNSYIYVYIPIYRYICMFEYHRLKSCRNVQNKGLPVQHVTSPNSDILPLTPLEDFQLLPVSIKAIHPIGHHKRGMKHLTDKE